MPFDPVIGVDTDPAEQPAIGWETDGADYVPDMHHIAPDVMLLADSSLLAMLRLPGYAFELESMRTRNARRKQINAVILGIADNNVQYSTHLIRHKHVPPLPPATFRNRFARRLFKKYERNVLGSKLVANDWYISVVVSPRFRPVMSFKRRLMGMIGRRPKAEPSDAVVRQLGAIMQALTAYFSHGGGVRIGLCRDHETGYLRSEIAEARRLMIAGRYQKVPVTNGTMADAIYTERVRCGTLGIQIDGLDGPRYGKTVSMRDYPGEKTRTGQLSHLADVRVPSGVHSVPDEDFPFVLAQSFRFQGREESKTRIYFKVTRLVNAFSNQVRGILHLKGAQEEVESGETVRGHHNFGMTVFGPDMDAVNRAASATGAAIVKGGCVAIHDDGGSFAAFWSSLPGNPSWLEGRSGSISFKNLTAMSSLEGFPTGSPSGHWGRAIIRFMTSGGTAYDFVTHVGDVGHAVFIGRSGSGKTLLMLLLAAALGAVMDERDRVFYFDKDQGAEPGIRALGGAYLNLKAGAPSGMAPLRGLTNTPGNRAFLEHLFATLMMLDGRGALQPTTVTMLRRAVVRQMRLPPEQRSIGAVRAFLGYGQGRDGERLDRWCRGGADGWLFDNDEDLVRTDAQYVGFDLTALFKHPACAHVAAYLRQRISEVIDGRRITVICDEVRYYLHAPEFAEQIMDFSLTLRKLNGQLWIAGQEPSHVSNSSVGTALVNQAQTRWLFPARDASEEDYERLGCTRPMYRAITETMQTLPYRTVLLQRESGSAILRIELNDMEDEVLVLSGREGNVRKIPAILEKIGDETDKFADEFIGACRPRKETVRETVPAGFDC